jgi:ACS family sodium-dependent inorganic phosphate cotransporter-like MFS transporter 9
VHEGFVGLYMAAYICFVRAGFVGVYMAGYILETTKSWSAVFNQTAAICVFGYFIFLFLGTGRRII